MILSSISVETWLIVTAASELTKYMILVSVERPKVLLHLFDRDITPRQMPEKITVRCAHLLREAPISSNRPRRAFRARSGTHDGS